MIEWQIMNMTFKQNNENCELFVNKKYSPFEIIHISCSVRPNQQQFCSPHRHLSQFRKIGSDTRNLHCMCFTAKAKCLITSNHVNSLLWPGIIPKKERINQIFRHSHALRHRTSSEEPFATRLPVFGPLPLFATPLSAHRLAWLMPGVPSNRQTASAPGSTAENQISHFL